MRLTVFAFSRRGKIRVMEPIHKTGAQCAGDATGGPEEQLLTTSDVAKREQISERCVLQWAKNGTLTPAYQVGRVVRFSPDYRNQLKASKK
jgi:hypothetical protein